MIRRPPRSTPSLHDALPISGAERNAAMHGAARPGTGDHGPSAAREGDRKSTRLNSSHSQISYAVFCLKKKKKKQTQTEQNIKVYTHLYNNEHRQNHVEIHTV